MQVVNFAHPLTADQRGRLEALTGRAIETLVERQAKIDDSTPLLPQAAALVNSAGLSSTDWQSASVLIVLPGYAVLAAAVLAELHGRMGHFPTIARLRPEPGTTPVRYEVAELLNLQQIRDVARAAR